MNTQTQSGQVQSGRGRAALPLILEDTYVRQDEHGRYSLNDLHQAAGGEKRHAPNEWLRNRQTQDLVAELSKPGIPGFNDGNTPVLAGTNQQVLRPFLASELQPVTSVQSRGTFVVRELVYAYAMWISPAFHLKVIRTFDALVTGRLGSNTAASNAMIGQSTGLPTAQLVALQVQGWKIVDRLKAEQVPELRQDLYEQLRRVYADLGQTPPPLTAMGSEAPPQPAAAMEFWAVYQALLGAGVQVNHSRRPGLIAVNLKQFAQVAAAHGMRLAPSAALKDALRASRAPRFLDVRTVNSAVLGSTIHCWVFLALEGGAA